MTFRAYVAEQTDDSVDRGVRDLDEGHLPEGRRIKFPEAVVYVDRCLVGHFGNLSRLGATGPWGRLIAKHIRRGRQTGVSQSTA